LAPAQFRERGPEAAERRAFFLERDEVVLDRESAWKPLPTKARADVLTLA